MIKSQTQSKMLSAERDATIVEIAAKADGTATTIRARAEAEGVKIKGAAVKSIAESFQNDPIALEIYGRYQQIELVSKANNPHLFFTPNMVGNQPQLTLPVSSVLNS